MSEPADQEAIPFHPALPATTAGPGDVDSLSPGTPRVVFLHGFGGAALQWWPVQKIVGEHHPTVAYTLPGHGRASDWPDHARIVAARNAVVDEILHHDMRVHLVGHSRGGAVACLVAMKVPDRMDALTLLAPGGFGPQIDAATLRAFASARTREELEPVLATLHAPAPVPPEAVELQVALRRRPGKVEALEDVCAGMLDGDTQGTLDLARIEAAAYPVTVVWGERDAVLPVSQARAVARADVRILSGLGHMLMDEAPDAIADIILEQLRSGHT